MRLQRHVASVAAAAICQAVLSPAHAEVVVRMETSLGDIDIQLYDAAAPNTVANFLNYVRNNAYNGTFIHRSLPGFVLQGGGYYHLSSLYLEIPTDPPIVNEFDPSRSNVRGTIAMAKVENDPDSATSQWFFNLVDNSADLDEQNGGFSVFGEVIGDGMQVVDAIADLDVWNMSYLSQFYGHNFTNTPLIGFVQGDDFIPSQHLVYVNRVREIVNVQGNQALVLSNNGNTVGLTAVAPATLANVSPTATPASSGAPADVTFREGFFSFEIYDLTPGGSVQVAMELPSDYRPNTYYMYGPTPDNATAHWYEFTYNGRTGAEFFNNNFVVLHFVDGERGDADLTANGSIRDPGAPGIATLPPAVSSGGGGGCTLNRDTPFTSRADLWLLLLSLLAYPALRKHPSQPAQRGPGRARQPTPLL